MACREVRLAYGELAVHVRLAYFVNDTSKSDCITQIVAEGAAVIHVVDRNAMRFCRIYSCHSSLL